MRVSLHLQDKQCTCSQTMYRIKDPERSLDFYTRVMGMTLLNKLDFPDMEFSLYFLGQVRARGSHPASKWISGCMIPDNRVSLM